MVRAGQEPHLLGLALLTALLASVIPYSLELAALRRVPGQVFSILLSLEPAFAALFGWLLLSQRIEGLRLLAIALVVLASMGTTVSASVGARRARRRAARVAEEEPAGLIPPEEVVVGGAPAPCPSWPRTPSRPRPRGAGEARPGYRGPHASLRLRRRLRPVHPGGGLPAPARRGGCRRNGCRGRERRRGRGRGADRAALLAGARGAG
ncbi:EamA family transporter [Rothia sp. BD8]|uniref:EamA family transporter n=1 Tax=Rothia sp. BD8 TaxID=2953894 RepID=UPI00383E1A85